MKIPCKYCGFLTEFIHSGICGNCMELSFFILKNFKIIEKIILENRGIIKSLDLEG